MNSVPEQGEQHELIGSLLRGTYRVLRTLDQGGMGMVFEAEHTRLHRKVAVKVLAKHLASDEQALARFNREAEIVSHLQSPYIVQILDFDTTEAGEPFIVMELLRGESLSARLEREGCLSIAEAARIAYQTATGLSVAHASAIVHRDLKPGNIYLVELPGQGTMVKLLDFGISKRAGVGRSLTGEFDVLGTPDYMAPEQALGKTASVDHRGDQYALAVIAFEMLCGQTPFFGESVMDVLQKVASEPPPDITRIAPQLPVAVNVILQRALSKDPEERFDTILTFATALSSAAGCSLPPPMSALGLAATVPAASDTPTPVPVSRERPASGSHKVPDKRVARIATASTLSGSSTVSDVRNALDLAHQAFGLGDLNLAVSYAEQAMRLADTFDTAEARDMINEKSPLLDRIFETRIGRLTQRLTVKNVPSSEMLQVSPEQAFLLSRVDGGLTVEEAVDLSPLPRRETLRLLLVLSRDGLVSIG
ncbi:MAG TPA: serine/threonine-protein kinase [Polyangiaceae bacterium]|jgi:serine/threonine protein kinase